jgi:GntP family gluconate:H+ symporter
VKEKKIITDSNFKEAEETKTPRFVEFFAAWCPHCQRMMPIVLLLAGAGSLGGLITGSEMPQMLVDGMAAAGIPGVMLSPISGVIMASAAGSTVTGTILASQSFAETIIAYGVPALSAAVMMHAGALFIDVMPHGNIFLGSKESMKMEMGERLKVLPYEAAVGFVLVLVATVFYGFIL